MKRVLPIRNQLPLDQPPRLTAIVRDRLRTASASFKAIWGEIMRLNAIGFSGRSGEHPSRRERAARVRKELAERYRGHSRCC